MTALRTSVTAVVAYLVFVCAMPFTALAHATPVSYTPNAGATELVTPSSIYVSFTERIEEGASSLTVFAPDGSKVNQGKGVLAATDTRLFSVPISDAGEGIYTVSWQVVSVDDGHFTKGAFSFLVDSEGAVFEGTAEGTTEVSYSSKAPEAVLGFAGLFGESIFLAVLVLLYVLVRTVPAHMYASMQTLLERLVTHAVTFAAVAFLGSGAITLLRKSLELAALQEIAPVEALLVYAQSSVGTFAVLKLACAVIFVGLFIANRKRLFTLSRPVFLALSAALAAILVMQSYVSHAAASLFLPELSIVVTFIHLVSKEFVIGGILIMLALSIALYERNVELLRGILVRFDLYASWALLFAAVSGVYVTWLHLKSFESLTHTEWGERFIALLVVTCMLGVFRLFHQFYLDPRVQERKSRRLLLYTLPSEASAGLLVLFFSAYIAITTPAFTVEQYAFSSQKVSEGVVIELDVHPYEEGMFRLTFTDGQTGEPAQVRSVMLTTSNEALNIGPNVIELQERFEGGYVFQEAELSPEGEWEIVANAVQTHGYDARAAFALKYPDDVQLTRYTDEIRSFDEFAVLCVVLALLSVACCKVFIWWSIRVVRSQNDKPRIIEPDPYMSTRTVAGALGAVLLLCIFLFAWQLVLVSDFQKRCVSDGFHWIQSYPAREFDATSKNAVMGCNVHEGHYHFADQREYDFFTRSAE